MIKAVEITISGKVQGIYFRKKTKELADKLGIRGWVRNNNNDTVSVWAEGEEKDLQRLTKESYNAPDGGSVSNIQAIWKDATDKFSNFNIET